jgi:hypothetical protein
MSWTKSAAPDPPGATANVRNRAMRAKRCASIAAILVLCGLASAIVANLFDEPLNAETRQRLERLHAEMDAVTDARDSAFVWMLGIPAPAGVDPTAHGTYVAGLFQSSNLAALDSEGLRAIEFWKEFEPLRWCLPERVKCLPDLPRAQAALAQLSAKGSITLRRLERLYEWPSWRLSRRIPIQYLVVPDPSALSYAQQLGFLRVAEAAALGQYGEAIRLLARADALHRRVMAEAQTEVEIYFSATMIARQAFFIAELTLADPYKWIPHAESLRRLVRPIDPLDAILVTAVRERFAGIAEALLGGAGERAQSRPFGRTVEIMHSVLPAPASLRARLARLGDEPLQVLATLGVGENSFSGERLSRANMALALLFYQPCRTANDFLSHERTLLELASANPADFDRHLDKLAARARAECSWVVPCLINPVGKNLLRNELAFFALHRARLHDLRTLRTAVRVQVSRRIRLVRTAQADSHPALPKAQEPDSDLAEIEIRSSDGDRTMVRFKPRAPTRGWTEAAIGADGYITVY